MYCKKTGTRRELLACIKRDGPIYNYHMFVNQWTSWSIMLRHETFDGVSEIDITADWAAGYKMMQHDNPKCSHGTTCNQYCVGSSFPRGKATVRWFKASALRCLANLVASKRGRCLASIGVENHHSTL